MKSKSIKFKKSHQYSTTETHSPYHTMTQDLKPLNSLKSLKVSHKPKALSSSIILENSSHQSLIKRILTLTLDPRKLDESKSTFLEGLLQERLENFQNGISSYPSELKILDSIYQELKAYFHKFDRILTILRLKYEECFKNDFKESCCKELEKIKNKNEILLKKINNLSSINQTLLNESQNLKDSLKEYERLFEINPDVLINYQNIVDQMLDQCKTIEILKKDNRALRKSQIADKETISQLKLQLKKQFSCSSLDIEIN